MVAGDEEEEDRISKLPDEIIHKILAHLRSTKQPAQLTILSKRWTHLWPSFPVLEFHDRDFKLPLAELTATAAAVTKKFTPPLLGSRSNTLAMESLRIQTEFFTLVDELFDLAAKNPPREIEIEVDFELFGRDKYRIPVNNFFRRLQVLKLKRCDFSLYGNFYDNPFAGLGSSLKVLSLRDVKFPRDWDLNSMIAGASLLEKLDLCGNLSTSRLQVVDHPSLKVMTCQEIIDVREIEIIGAPSLEKLVFRTCSLDHVQLSSTPNLKDLVFDWDVRFTARR